MVMFGQFCGYLAHCPAKKTCNTNIQEFAEEKHTHTQDLKIRRGLERCLLMLLVPHLIPRPHMVTHTVCHCSLWGHDALF